MSDRITALEETVAHQGKTIDELSEQLTEQWKVIDRMKRMLERLGERLENLDAGTGEAPVPKPPQS